MTKNRPQGKNFLKIDPGVNIPWGSKYHMTPGKVKKTWESVMLIGTSRWETVFICSLLLVVVHCGYQIYFLSLNTVCKGIKLYLYEVPDIEHT
jgi:hypothetical protein